MKIGLVSDIHGNLPALMSVLSHMAEQDVKKKVCLGDIVGYGPFPNECVSLTVSNFDYIVMGNHDLAVNDPDERLGFTTVARNAIEWTAKAISKDNATMLSSLQYEHKIGDDLLFIHGDPCRPFGYIESTRNAKMAFDFSTHKFDVAFVGHTHVPANWIEFGESVWEEKIRHDSKNGVSSSSYGLEKDFKAIFNVGSVGQPRDRDPRASYAIYDTEERKITHFKIPYGADLTIGKMQQLGFPTDAWMRLMYGE